MGVLFLREQGCSWILKASLTLCWERSTQSCLILLDFSEVHAAPTGWITLQSMARGIPHSCTGQTAAGSWDHCSATWWDKLDLDSPDTVLSCVPGAAQRTISNFTAYLFSPLDLELEFLMSNISISDKLLNKKDAQKENYGQFNCLSICSVPGFSIRRLKPVIEMQRLYGFIQAHCWMMEIACFRDFRYSMRWVWESLTC